MLSELACKSGAEPAACLVGVHYNGWWLISYHRAEHKFARRGAAPYRGSGRQMRFGDVFQRTTATRDP